jgi:hypothetical protein
MAVGIVGLAIPTSAGAATTIGSDLATAPNTSIDCVSPGCTFSQRTLPNREITAPADGVIVRWRIRVGSAVASTPQAVRLRVIEGTGAASTAVGASNAETVPAAAGTYTFDTQLPVLAGSFIGIDCCNTNGTFFNGTPGARPDIWAPPLADGETRAPSVTGNDIEIMVNADVEPDCDSDGLGDETQDPDLFGGSCPLRGRTLTLDANKNKVKKGKRVRLSGRVTEIVRQACQAGQTVQLQRKRPNQTTFTTVEQLQTDTVGSFSARKKVKKTFEYRAVVAESADCQPGLSNTEKVKVKRKK